MPSFKQYTFQIYSFDKYFFNEYYTMGIVLDTGNMSVNNTNKNPCHHKEDLIIFPYNIFSLTTSDFADSPCTPLSVTLLMAGIW